MSVMFGSAASPLMQVTTECDQAGQLISLDGAGGGGTVEKGLEGFLSPLLKAVRKPRRDDSISIRHSSS